jgi:CHAT domain-containing protein
VTLAWNCRLALALVLALAPLDRGAAQTPAAPAPVGTWAEAERLFEARDYAAARTAYRALQGTAAAAAQPAGLLEARAALCDIRLGELDAGEAGLARALDLATSAGTESVEGTVYRGMARLAASRGQPDTARGLDWAALVLHERLGEAREALLDRLDLARDEYDRNPETAWGLYAEAVETAEALEDRARQAVALQGLAALSQRFGDLDWAANLYGQARRLQEARGATKAALETRAYEAMLRVRTGDAEGGLAEIDAVLVVPGLTPEMVRQLRTVAGITEERLGRYRAALARIEPEVTALTAPGATVQRVRARYLFVLAARLARKLGDPERARTRLVDARKMPTEGPETESLFALEAAALAEAGRDAKSTRALLLAAAAAGERLRVHAVEAGTGGRFYGGQMTEELRALFAFHAGRGEVAEAHAAGRILKGVSFAEGLRREGRAPTGLQDAPGGGPAPTPWPGHAPEAGPAADLNGLRTHLPARSVLLDFYSLDDALYVFWLSSERVAVARIPIGAAELGRAVEDFRASIRARDPQWAAPATHLGRRLLSPFAGLMALEHPELLLLSPHGPLHALPFEALIVDGKPLVAGRSVAYLPVPSLPLTWPVEAEPAETPEDALAPTAPGLVVGDPDRTLPSAREEAVRIGRALGVAPLLGAAATVSAFRSAAGTARRIHLATHAAQPWGGQGAWLQLADARLAPWQIRALPLHADLVVLSACETGVAPVTAGDESPEALDRAFMSAGARTVVASRWPVDDAATSALMERFYAALAGEGPGAALSTAMRALQTRGGAVATTASRGLQATNGEASQTPWSHPYYWAAFKVNGDPRPQRPRK